MRDPYNGVLYDVLDTSSSLSEKGLVGPCICAHTSKSQKEKDSLRFSAITTGASSGGSPELCPRVSLVNISSSSRAQFCNAKGGNTAMYVRRCPEQQLV